MLLSVSLFTDFQSALSLLSKASLHLWPRPLQNVWFHVSSLFDSAILNFQWVFGHAGIPGNADSLPKPGTSLATAMVPGSSPQLLTKLVTPSVANGDVTFPHSPSHLNCPISTVTPLELVFSRPICFELSAVASKVKAFYSCRKSVVRKTLSAAPVDTFCSASIIFFLAVLLVSLNAILWLCNLHSSMLLNCWVSAKFRCFFIPHKGLGSITPQ